MNISRKLFHIFPVSILLLTGILYAQQDIAYTFPAEPIKYSDAKPAEWTYLCTTGDILYSVNENSVQPMDSTNFVLLIKEIPDPAFFTQIKSEKMREHRELIDYSDRTHLQFNYDGYENYAYSVKEKEINRKERKYRVIRTMDYDVSGSLLEMKRTETPEWIAAGGEQPESYIINSIRELPAIYHTGARRK